MQANSEISVLHLINDRPNCSGLLLLSTFFVSCWTYYMKVGIWVYLLGKKLLLTFLFNVYKRFFFIFVTFLRFLTFFLFWWTFSSSMAKATLSELRFGGSVDVVSCFKRPQVSTIANGYWL